MLVGFSWNWVEEFITKSCQTSTSVAKIGTVTVILYFRCEWYFAHIFCTSHLPWITFRTDDIHKSLLCFCEFHKNQGNESHTILRDVNEFLSVLPTFYCATSWKVVSSSPNRVIVIFHWLNPSGSTKKLVLTPPLTEMSSMKSPGGKGGQCIGLTTLPPPNAKCL